MHPTDELSSRSVTQNAPLYRVALRGDRVRDLIEALQQVDPDAIVLTEWINVKESLRGKRYAYLHSMEDDL